MPRGVYIIDMEIRTNARSLRSVLYPTHGLFADRI